MTLSLRGALLLATLACSSAAQASGPALGVFAGEEAIVHGTLDISWAACQRAKIMVAQRSSFELCRAGATKVLARVAAAATALGKLCQEGTPSALSETQEQLRAVERSLASMRNLLEKISARTTELEATLAQADSPEARLAAEQERTQVKAQKRALEAQLEAALAERKLRLETADRAIDFEAQRRSMDDGIDAAVLEGASPADFLAYLRSPERQAACAAVSDALIAAYAEVPASKATEQVESDDPAHEAAAKAHATDVLRKGTNLPSALTDATGIIENPGAPDALTLSVLTALGAARETTGTQAVLTLNLARTLAPARPLTDAPAAVRNLFLRAQLPLTTTTNDSIGGATPDPEATASVRRFQFVLGTSLLDQSDPRLNEHRSCFRSVVDYLPAQAEESREKKVGAVRAALFDVCSSIAAHEQRLAVRAGVGLVTTGTGSEARTRAEIYAGSIVYGPTPWVYLNAFYQRILEPLRVHNAGFGFSFAGNVGGRPRARTPGRACHSTPYGSRASRRAERARS